VVVLFLFRTGIRFLLLEQGIRQGSFTYIERFRGGHFQTGSFLMATKQK